MNKKASVNEGHNRLNISVSQQTYITVRKESGAWMATQKTKAGEVFVNLHPGEYIIETDGMITSIRSDHYTFKSGLGKGKE